MSNSVIVSMKCGLEIIDNEERGSVTIILKGMITPDIGKTLDPDQVIELRDALDAWLTKHDI